jgi:hypothetical protein
VAKRLGEYAANVNSVKEWRRHHRVILNLYGRPLPGSVDLHPRGHDLWDRLHAFRTKFIVDNNIPWEKWSLLSSHSDIEFILGTTTLNERAQLLTLFQSANRPVKRFKNVFTLEGRMFEVAPDGSIMKGQLDLALLDNAALSLHSRRKLATIGDFNHPLGIKNPKAEVHEEEERLEGLVQMGGIALKGKVEQMRTSCFADYRRSIEVARLCLACLLATEPKARNTFKKKGAANSFRDAGVIKDALFLKAGILSGDKLVQKMARMCGISAYEAMPNDAQLKTVSPGSSPRSPSSSRADAVR